MKFILALGSDGILREYQWGGEKHLSHGYIMERNMENVVSSGDGKYFAILSN